MLEHILSYSGLLFLPLISLIAFAATTLVLRLVRLARFPGFRRRFDRELGFLTRGPKLIIAGVVALAVLIPTLAGVLLPQKPLRYAGPSDGHESGLSLLDVVEETDPPEAPPRAPESTKPESAGERQGATAAAAARNREALESLKELVPLRLEEHRYRRTEMLEPGVLPEELDSVDVLFVHAHPDDESLDFAVLMAALSRQGLTVATLLLTDGESGIDRYPYRTSPEGYEERELQGDALRAVRIREAERALSVLGSDYYLRLGLKNHPYNGTADEKSLAAVLESWGGEGTVLSRIEAVFLATSPQLVVSPDLPSRAREHFEHEATGYLVRTVVEKLRQEGRGPEAYLVSVDPFQREFYQNAVAVPGSLGGDLRAIQQAALSQHHTQADASVIGLRRLRELPAEYYQPVFWNMEPDLGTFLGIEKGSFAGESELPEAALAYRQEVGDGSSPAGE